MTQDAEPTPSFLDHDADLAIWVPGPQPEMPTVEWTRFAERLLNRRFGLKRRHPSQRDLVQRVLVGIEAGHSSPLPYFLLHWPALRDPVLPVYFGLVDTDVAEDIAGQWLVPDDELIQEPPEVEELEAPEGTTIRRTMPRSTDEDGDPVFAARYVVDTGHPTAIVLAHTASNEAAGVVDAEPDIQTFLRSIRVYDGTADRA